MKRILVLVMVLSMFVSSVGVVQANCDTPNCPETFEVTTSPTSFWGDTKTASSTPRSFSKDGHYISGFFLDNIPSGGSKQFEYNLRSSDDLNDLPSNKYLKLKLVYKRGRSNKLYVKASNYVQVLPGLYAPSKISVWVYARSPKGMNAGTGRTHCEMELKYLPQLY